MDSLTSNPSLYPWNASDEVELILGGRRYQWRGWFGCQLVSVERSRVPAGTTRDIAGRRFTVFRTTRLGFFKYETAWALPDNGTADDHRDRIVGLQNDLRKLI